jgi:signal transduction histidine kinase/ActR/RegA family two-component response regulator
MSAIGIIVGFWSLIFEIYFFHDFILELYFARIIFTIIALFTFVFSYRYASTKYCNLLTHILLFSLISSFVITIHGIPKTVFINSQILALLIFTTALIFTWEPKQQIIAAIYYNLLFAAAIIFNDANVYLLPNLFAMVMFVCLNSFLSIAVSFVNYNLRKKISLESKSREEAVSLLLKESIEKEKAEEVNKVKSYFFAQMSHELRTPFVGIRGYAEILQEKLTDPEDKVMADGIIQTSLRLTDTLNKILSLSKLEFEKFDIKFTGINLTEIIEDCTNLFASTAEQKNLFYRKKIFKERVLIKSDERILRDILINLLNNAVKFTVRGGIEVTSVIEKRQDGEILSFKVKDTGMGIPQDKQDLIWREFRQVSEGINRSFEGTGLGLTITKKYVELLGGRIYLESELGKGSTFMVEIPIERGELSNSVRKESPEVQNIDDTIGQSTKKRLLYVEDDLHAQNVLLLALSKYYQLDVASDAEKAMDKIKNQKYDSFLIDINLRYGTDGVQLMEMIRQIPEYRDTPMIAITAYAADSDRDEFLSKGFSHYISKPFPLIDLINLIGEVLTGNRAN